MPAAIPTLDELRLDPLFERVKPNLNRPYSGQLWLALSAGVDSVALLYLALASGLKPKVLYIHHGLHASADQWLELARNHSEQLGLSFFYEHLHLGQASEDKARERRYLAISELISDHDTLMLAHHAGDQLETLLMRFCRGTSVHGLVGLRTHNQRLINGQSMNLWRPLLGVPKKELYQLASRHKLEYAEDPSNHTQAVDANLRVYLRHHVTPKLAERFDSIENNAQRMSELMSESAQILAEVCAQDLANCQVSTQVMSQAMGRVYSVEKLRKLSCARRRSALSELLAGTNQRADRRKVLELEALVLSPPSSGQAVWQFAQTDYRFYQGKLYQIHQYPANPTPSQINLSRESKLIACNASWVTSDSNQTLGIAAWVLNQPLALQSIPTGARLNLLDRAGSRTAKKLLQELDVEPWLRGSCRLLHLGVVPLALITPHGFYLLQQDLAKQGSLESNLLEVGGWRLRREGPS